MINRKVASFEILDEYAFVCTGLDDENVELLTSPVNDTNGDFDFGESFVLGHFSPEYSVPFRKGCTGMLHIIGVSYVDGNTDIVLSNTVFPDGRYRNDFTASSIAHTEQMIRNGQLRRIV